MAFVKGGRGSVLAVVVSHQSVETVHRHFPICRHHFFNFFFFQFLQSSEKWLVFFSLTKFSTRFFLIRNSNAEWLFIWRRKFACFTREAFVLFIIYYFYFFCKSKWKLKKYILIPKLSLNILKNYWYVHQVALFFGAFSPFFDSSGPTSMDILLFFNRAGLLTPPKIL